MENQRPATLPPPTSSAKFEWTSANVYALGAICLVLGIVLGALYHGSAQPSGLTTSSSVSEQQMSGRPAQLPQSIESQVARDPVFEKVKSDPNNFDLLSQAGVAAMKAGDPKLAVEYYARALTVKDDAEVRTDLGNAYFRSGNVDQSLKEFAVVLRADPKNDNALYNTGVVRLVAKNDAKGAIASWKTLLRFHPDHPHKDQVLEMIKRAKNVATKA